MTAILHERVSPTTLGVVRATVFAIWLVTVVPDPLSFYGALPASMFEPIGVFMLVPDGVWRDLLTPAALDAFKAVLVVVLVLAAVGVRPYRPIAALAALMLTVHQGLVREFTFAAHEELALLVLTYLLVAFPAADGFAWPRRRTGSAAPGVYSTALQSMTLMLLVPYCAIAAHRLAVGAPDVFTGDSLPSWIARLHGLNRDVSGLGLWVLEHPALVVVVKAAFVVTTIFELLAPLCLVWPRFRRVWVVVIVAFHIVNWWLLNLFFWQNAVLVLLLVCDTERVVSRIAARRSIPYSGAGALAGRPPSPR
jgi:hypothetical protein